MKYYDMRLLGGDKLFINYYPRGNKFVIRDNVVDCLIDRLWGWRRIASSSIVDRVVWNDIDLLNATTDKIVVNYLNTCLKG